MSYSYKNIGAGDVADYQENGVWVKSKACVWEGDLYYFKTRGARLWSDLVYRTVHPSMEHTIGRRSSLYKDSLNLFQDFDSFVEWCVDQPGYMNKEVNGKYWQLDKDILVQGNKVYGPETCCFVPPRVNNLTTGGFKGGTLDKHGKWTFTVRKIDQYEQKRFYNQEEGLKWYKEIKEAYVKEVADEYKNVLDQRVYDALYLWQVK